MKHVVALLMPLALGSVLRCADAAKEASGARTRLQNVIIVYKTHFDIGAGRMPALHTDDCWHDVGAMVDSHADATGDRRDAF